MWAVQLIRRVFNIISDNLNFQVSLRAGHSTQSFWALRWVSLLSRVISWATTPLICCGRHVWWLTPVSTTLDGVANRWWTSSTTTLACLELWQKYRQTGTLLGQVKKWRRETKKNIRYISCLLYTSPSPRDRQKSRMPSSA